MTDSRAESRRHRGERGSSSVFLLMVLAGLLTLALVYARGADRLADLSYGDGALYAAGRSVLAGYDRPLKEDYGIIAFPGTASVAQSRMEKYAGYSLAFNQTIDLRSLGVSVDRHSLANPEVFRKQITEYAKYALAQHLLDNPVPGEATLTPVDTGSDKELRNEKVWNQLPGKDLPKGGNLWRTIQNGLDHVDDVFTATADNLLIEIYIADKFKNAQDDLPTETFFRYEAEYILEGENSDRENYQAFRQDLLLLRNGANLLFLLSDPAKKAELAAAAQVIAPGPGGLLVQGLLAEAWALVEAENDVQLLEHGKRVPLLKTAESWATDIKSVTEDLDQGYIDKDNVTGFVYRDYLRIFLFFLDDETKMLRTMDLIQINMQGRHSSTFRIRDHSVGLDVDANINGRHFNYVHTYE